LLRIHAWLEFGLFEKVSPALVTVFGRLLLFESSHGSGRIVLAADDFNYPTRYISSYVVPDDGVGGFRFVTCQIYPV
jgi:hypothetical protein